MKDTGEQKRESRILKDWEERKIIELMEKDKKKGK